MQSETTPGPSLQKTQRTTPTPSTIHFPTDWRRNVCLKLIVLVVWALGGKVTRHGR